MDLLAEKPPEKETARERWVKEHPTIYATLTRRLRMVLDLTKGDRSYPQAWEDLFYEKLNPCLELTGAIDFEKTFEFCKTNYITFRQAKEIEMKRTGKEISDKTFILLLCVVYARIQGDTGVLDAAWQRLRDAGIVP